MNILFSIKTLITFCYYIIIYSDTFTCETDTINTINTNGD